MSSTRFLLSGGTVLAIITMAVYSGVLSNDFVEFDDNIYVTYNTHTAEGLTPAGVFYAFTTFDSGNWIPLTWLSFQLDTTLFGFRPLGFHATNVILHIANVLLFLTWMVRTTGSRWRSLVAALIFAIHPLHVESVAWIAERKDVLSTFWMLMAMHAYERYARRPATVWYLAACLCFSLGLLSKSMIVTLPFLLLLVDVWPLERYESDDQQKAAQRSYPRRTFTWLLIEKLPFIGLSLVAGMMTMRAAASSSAFVQLKGLTLDQRLGNALCSYSWYLAKTFSPTNLIALYRHPMANLAGANVVASFVILTIVTGYVAINGRRRRYLLFGWLWFIFSLLPVIGLLQVGAQAHADRYSYVPHLGLLIMIVWEARYWTMSLRWRRYWQFSVISISLSILAWLTICQIAVWRNSEALWQHAVSVDPRNSFAQMQLGLCRLEAGRLDEGLQSFQSASRQSPELREASNRLFEIYRKRLEKQTDESQFLNELGFFYARENYTEAARIRFQQAVTASPENSSARFNLVLTLIQLGRYWDTNPHLERLLEQQPDDADFHATLGTVLEKEGQFPAARDQYATALKLRPEDEETRKKLRTIESTTAPATTNDLK